MATKKTVSQRFDFDVTKATDAELEKIRSTIIEGLVSRAARPDLVADGHDRHYSTHSSG